MGIQNGRSPNFEIFGTPNLESQEKRHLGVAPMMNQRKYYKGEGGGFPPSPGCGESCGSV